MTWTHADKLKRTVLLLIVLALFGNLAFAAYTYVVRQQSLPSP